MTYATEYLELSTDILQFSEWERIFFNFLSASLKKQDFQNGGESLRSSEGLKTWSHHTGT